MNYEREQLLRSNEPFIQKKQQPKKTNDNYIYKEFNVLQDSLDVSVEKHLRRMASTRH